MENEHVHPVFRDILSRLTQKGEMMKRIEDANHWSNRNWVLVESDHPGDVEELSIWTDGESFKPVLVICDGTKPTPEDRDLGEYICRLHNARLKRGQVDVRVRY